VAEVVGARWGIDSVRPLSRNELVHRSSNDEGWLEWWRFGRVREGDSAIGMVMGEMGLQSSPS